MKKLVLYKYGSKPSTVFQGTDEEVQSKIIEMGLDNIGSFYFDKDPLKLGGIMFKRVKHYEYYVIMGANERKPGNILPETVLDPSGVPGWSGGAWTIAFVYSNMGNFVVKGYYKEVQDELDKLSNGGVRYFVNISLWHAGRHRSIWKCTNAFIHEPEKDNKFRWTFVKYRRGEVRKSLSFRRLPKRWIPEIENFLYVQ